MKTLFRPYFAILGRVWGGTFPSAKSSHIGLLEKLVFTLVTLARLPSPSNFKHFFSSASPERKRFMDAYVIFWTALAVAALVGGRRLPVWVAVLFGFEIWDICSYRVFFFLVKSQEKPWAGRLRHTLLIAAANLVEVIIGFAVIHLHVGDISRNCAAADPLTSSIDALYFSVVTIMTVGYGDFIPCNTAGRMLVIAEIVAAVVFIFVAIPLLLSVFAAELRTVSNSNELE